MSSSPLPLLGWTGESQHGEADVLRSVSSREAGPYRSLPVREIVKGCGPTQIRVSITKKKVLWKKIFSIDKINSWHHFLVCVVCTSLYCDVVTKPCHKCLLCLTFQLCVHCHGSPGPASDGLPLSEHQPVCGEFPEDGAKAAGVRQTQSADPRNQLGE